MKLEYDKSVDAAYIYLKYPLADGEVKKSVECKKDIIFDFDDHGKLIGVEILNAKKVLGRKVLAETAGN